MKGASITLHQRVMRGEELLVEASVRVAFISGGRARPIPKPLRIAMRPIRKRCNPESEFRFGDLPESGGCCVRAAYLLRRYDRLEERCDD